MKLVFGSTAWAKAASLSALVLLVSLGLCGVNLAAFSHFDLAVSGGHVPGQEFQENLAGALIPLGILEALSIMGVAVSLLVSLIGMLVSRLAQAPDSGEGRNA